MRLDELYDIPEVLWEDDRCTTTINGIEYTFDMSLEEGKQKGIVGRVVKGAGALFSNPFVAGMTALWAADALKKYKKNKRMTTHFFAKTTEEKKLYDKIVNDLMATGSYKLVNTKFVDGGKLWTLKRSGT